MQKRRVLLVCSDHLFGESVEKILRAEADVELVGPWGWGDDIYQRITEANPDVVLITDEDSQREEAATLTSTIMEKNPNLPVIRAGLTENVVRVHSIHLLPASGADLLETIRNPPVVSVGKSSKERSKQQ